MTVLGNVNFVGAGTAVVSVTGPNNFLSANSIVSNGGTGMRNARTGVRMTAGRTIFLTW